MVQRYAYNYAIIDETGLCVDVHSTSENCDDDLDLVAIPECNPDYLLKYYNRADGKWYEDAAFTIEWSPA